MSGYFFSFSILTMSSTYLSSWATNVSPSPTLAIDAKAKELKAAGEDICAFAAGEPDFDTPEFIKEACAKALSEGKTKYAPAPGIMPLREALAAKYAALDCLSGVQAANVVVSPGGKFSCYLALLAVCQPGDEVIIPAPFWVSYPEMVKLTGATPRIVVTDESTGFKLSPEQLEAAITPQTKMFILNSPSNPTGALYSREDIAALVEVAVRKDILIMSDEIYEHLLYDGVEHVSPASISEEGAARTIVVSGFSKTFSMTGWRLGTLMAPLPIAKAVASLQSQTTSNATTFAQYGALEAMLKPDQSRDAIAGMLQVFDRRRLAMLDALNAIKGIDCFRSQGAFYLFPNISGTGLDSDALAKKLLEEYKVAVVPGSAFGAPDNIRLSYATSDAVIEKGLQRVAACCESL